MSGTRKDTTKEVYTHGNLSYFTGIMPYAAMILKHKKKAPADKSRNLSFILQLIETAFVSFVKIYCITSFVESVLFSSCRVIMYKPAESWVVEI